MLASTDLGWIQSEFDTLTGMFDWVGLQTNIRKTVCMVCRPCQAAGVRAYEAYTQRMAGERRRFKERHPERVLFPECGKELAKGYLVTHCQNQQVVAKVGLGA